MKIKIKTSETVEVEQLVEIVTPSWYCVNGSTDIRYYQINSEDDIIEVKETDKGASPYLPDHFAISRLPIKHMYKPERIFAGETISESEFNTALSKVMLKIAGVEICPTLERNSEPKHFEFLID